MIFFVAYLGFARTRSVVAIAVLFIFYGLFQGIFRSVGKALASDFVPVALGSVNVLALGYLVNLVLQANSDFARLGAACVLIAIAFLLLIGDAIGGLIAYWL